MCAKRAWNPQSLLRAADVTPFPADSNLYNFNTTAFGRYVLAQIPTMETVELSLRSVRAPVEERFRSSRVFKVV